MVDRSLEQIGYEAYFKALGRTHSWTHADDALRRAWKAAKKAMIAEHERRKAEEGKPNG